MQVHTPAIENGVFHDRFGKRGSDFSPNGMPSRSSRLASAMRSQARNPTPWCWTTKMRLPPQALCGYIG